MISRAAVAIAVAAVALTIVSADARNPPCQIGAATGNAVDPDQPPAVLVLSGPALSEFAASQRCDGAVPDSAKLAVLTRGRFRFAGSLDDLLDRVGAISTLPQVRYWSTTDKRWQHLVDAAVPLASPTVVRRGDFPAAELRRGGTFYYQQQDNRARGPVVYSLQVTVEGAHAAIVDSENITAVRYFMITLFPPHAMHTRMVLQRISTDLWELRLTQWFGPETSRFALGHDASFVNRAVAQFRHIAGIPTDQEPPVAP